MSKWNDKFEWAEPLPNECPPDDAITPSGEDYYRMVKSSPHTLCLTGNSIRRSHSIQMNVELDRLLYSRIMMHVQN